MGERVYLEDGHIRKKYPAVYKNDPTIGGQSMEQVRNLTLFNFAQQFVNVYEEKGKDVALLWAMGELTAEEMVEARPYVISALERAGYKLR